MSRKKHSKKHSKKQKNSSQFYFINWGLFVLSTILSAMVACYMYKYSFLAFRNINLIYAAVLAIVFFVALVTLLRKKGRILLMVLLLLTNLVTGMALYAFKSTADFSKKINNTASISEIEMSVLVPADSAIADVKELTTVLTPLRSDQANIEELLTHIQSDKNVTLIPQEVDSYQSAYDQIMSGSAQAMVMNGAYESLLEIAYPDFKEKVKKIYSYTLTKSVAPEDQASQEQATKSGVFNIYVSGIDTYGSISTVSRSDVNIILTVNVNTHKILLTTTPRDSYVQIPDGGGNQYDKLTHAGIYGVEASVKTLENLYGIDIQYYARINFTSFLNLIDLLGGVDIMNDQAFVAGGNDFPVGTVHLNSEKALVFVRERKSLESGDNDRGRNQIKVISAIINKLASVDSIANISSVVTGLQNSVQTNMDLETIMAIANKQLSSGSKFNVTSQDVTGTGSTGELPSYAMPNAALYMYSLDPASVEAAKQRMSAIVEE
ncbi:LytR family transcriptional regulator [Streptococcus sp. X16XC17]|uniref:LCP family glycopolymer transferase CpsA n=1 Tax=Streptococcus sp. X13SY08 TaxID=1676616 RepID=UPI00066FD6A8|nr:LCP family protein [Streptococcus sp. X16XC17]TCD46256.1 LytR family transcriptional regulator [Streptococcus sp. X16XC17]